MKKILITLTAAAALLLSGVSTVFAGNDFDKPHKVVIQVSSEDPLIHKIAINNAVNVQKALGAENVAVEIVAYGPGLSIMTPKSPESGRIPDLAMTDITFSACGNTMKKVEKKSGKMPKLVEGVTVVPAGVIRIMELQAQGYAYIRP
ncbi:MAG: intracellular sulfur oxidation DsrE/DsrF family protein [Parasphingorhabdus sp.]|jgi:intracellular sulfur oxidation DsrE/DsrF family protein